MKARPAVLAAALAIGVLAGCSGVVNGTGSTAGPAGASSPDFPSQSAAPSAGPSGSGSAAGPSASISLPTPTPVTPSGSSSGVPAGTDFTCPSVKYPYAHLSFTCITAGLVSSTGGGIWPLRESKSIETSTGWAVETGAGHWGPPGGKSLAAIATTVRTSMVDAGGYGTSPKTTTTSSSDTTVAGVKAHVLTTTFTLNKAFAATRKTKVTSERLWIVALQVGSDDVSLWYASVPNLVSSLWSKVPVAIASIHIV